jgi:hypothetical protein
MGSGIKLTVDESAEPTAGDYRLEDKAKAQL